MVFKILYDDHCFGPENTFSFLISIKVAKSEQEAYIKALGAASFLLGAERTTSSFYQYRQCTLLFYT